MRWKGLLVGLIPALAVSTLVAAQSMGPMGLQNGGGSGGGGGSGTVTSVTAGTNLTGGTITTSGTIGLGADVPLLDAANAWTGTNTFTNGPVVPGINSPGNAVIINLNQFGEGIDGFANIQVSLTGGAPGAAFAVGAFGTITNTAGVAIAESIPFTLNQTGTAGFVGWDCDPTLTAVGSGIQHCFSINPGDAGELAYWDDTGAIHVTTIGTTGAATIGGSLSVTAGGSISFSGRGTITSSAAGHLRMPANGSAPVVSACGTSPAIDATANDGHGTVTFGAGATTCTVTFATAYTTFAHCHVTFQSSLAAEAYSYTKTAITITATALSGNADYSCDGT